MCRITRYICLIKEEAHNYAVTNILNTPENVYNYLCADFKLNQRPEEHFLEIFINTKGKAIGYIVISKGTIKESLVHPREVFKAAVLANAYAIIIAHNHPSGEIIPSEEDKKITQRLKEAGDILGIPVIDHIIVGDNKYFSFKEHSYL